MHEEETVVTVAVVFLQLWLPQAGPLPPQLVRLYCDEGEKTRSLVSLSPQRPESWVMLALLTALFAVYSVVPCSASEHRYNNGQGLATDENLKYIRVTG